MRKPYLKSVPVVPYDPPVPCDYKYHKELSDYTTDSKEIDSIDREIMSFITKGFSSSYSIWSAMKREVKEKKLDKKVMTYRNTNKRVVRLSRLGLLEEIKPEVYSVHGRRDYKVTSKGLSSIIPYVLDHPGELDGTIQYMDQFKLDKNILRNALRERFYSAFRMVVEVPMRDYYDKDSHWFKLKEGNELLEAITKQTRVSPPPHDADKERTAELFVDALRSLEEESQITKKTEPKSKESKKNKKETTSDISEVLDEIYQVVDKYDKPSETISETTAGKALKEIDRVMLKYRPELESENESEPGIGVDEYIEDLVKKGYVSYNPKTSLYSVTKKGKIHIESDRLQLLEIYFSSTSHSQELSKLSDELGRTSKSDNEIARFQHIMKTVYDRKEKPT